MSTILDCRVGDQTPGLQRDIDLSVLVRCAGASGDFNRIHYDESYAKAGGLDTIIGHGARNPFRLGDRLTVTGEVTAHRIARDGCSHVELRLDCLRQDGVSVIQGATAAAVSIMRQGDAADG